MSFAMYELAANPEIQKKLYNEIQTVYEKHRCISYDAICEMEYLDRVIRGKFCIKIKISIIEATNV